jgi:TATA-binding protein-associated factor Taf7
MQITKIPYTYKKLKMTNKKKKYLSTMWNFNPKLPKLKLKDLKNNTEKWTYRRVGLSLVN